MQGESSATPLLTVDEVSSLPGQVCPFHPLSTLELDRKKIIAVIDTTFAVVKRKPERNQACMGFEPYDLRDTGAVLCQLTRQLGVGHLVGSK